MARTDLDTDGRAIVLLSEPYIYNPNRGRLGEILQQADLVSEKQILFALHEQNRFQDLKIGEILALRGWIERETADFFAERWRSILAGRERERLGYYLKEAGLLTEEQIASILAEQESLWLRFGTVAVLKGWLKQSTLDFFLENLFPAELSKPVHRARRKDLASRVNATVRPTPDRSKQTIHLIRELQDLSLVSDDGDEIEEISEDFI
jgi:hypothetical protein